MNSTREQLISTLSADLRPTLRPAGRAATVALWLFGSALFSAGMLLLDGPFRPGFAQQLASSPRFLLESLLGMVTIVSLGVAGLRLAIPDIRPLRERIGWPLVLLAAWLALYAYGFHTPSLPPSMDGKRAQCLLESALVGVPALIWGLGLARRWWPLHGAWTGLLLGCASGAMPALLMQWACMYSPAHIFLYHLGPGLALGAVGALAGAVLLRKR